MTVEKDTKKWPLDRMVDPNHALVRLTGMIDWPSFEGRFAEQFLTARQKPAHPARLLLGLALLRQIYRQPDETLPQRWAENPYYQYFCGETALQHSAPFDTLLVHTLPAPADRSFKSLVRRNLATTLAAHGIDGKTIDLERLVADGLLDQPPPPAPDEDGPAKPASIYDVAKTAGVSIKTVSLVINHRPNVSAKTRTRVQEAIKALSYQPNVFARGLASDRSFLIALLYEHPSTTYVTQLQIGALDRSREGGYHLVVEPMSPYAGDLNQRLQKLISSSGLHGVILPPPLCDNQMIVDALQRARIPSVRISPGRKITGITSVGIDEKKAGYDVTAYLISLGHKRIGFIKGHPDHGGVMHRYEGYRAALEAFDIPFAEDYCAQGFLTFQSGMEATEQLLDLDERPTAIFAANDDMAAGALVAAQKFHFRIPNDLSIAGFDDSMSAKIVWPQLTTCRLPVREMASEAIALLSRKIDPETPPRDIVLTHELIVRDSTTRPPDAT